MPPDRDRGEQVDRDEDAGAAGLACQADALLGQGRQDLVDAEGTAVDGEREANDGEAPALGALANLVASRQLVIGLDHLLNDDDAIGWEVRAEDPLELTDPSLELTLKGATPALIR